MHAKLLELFNKVCKLDSAEEDLIRASFEPYHLKKGEHFLNAGEVNRYIGFLRKGLVRYYILKDGEEGTFEFTREGEFIADYQSFSLNTPSVQNIQAIEDCELLIANSQSVQHIFNNTQNGNLLGRHVIEHRFNIMVNQLLSIYMHNPEERYRRFVANYSDLAQRIPQYLIASYVGIRPQSLSRIRKRRPRDIN